MGDTTSELQRRQLAAALLRIHALEQKVTADQERAELKAEAKALRGELEAEKGARKEAELRAEFERKLAEERAQRQLMEKQSWMERRLMQERMERKLLEQRVMASQKTELEKVAMLAKIHALQRDMAQMRMRGGQALIPTAGNALPTQDCTLGAQA